MLPTSSPVLSRRDAGKSFGKNNADEFGHAHLRKGRSLLGHRLLVLGGDALRGVACVKILLQNTAWHSASAHLTACASGRTCTLHIVFYPAELHLAERGHLSCRHLITSWTDGLPARQSALHPAPPSS